MVLGNALHEFLVNDAGVILPPFESLVFEDRAVGDCVFPEDGLLTAEDVLACDLVGKQVCVFLFNF